MSRLNSVQNNTTGDSLNKGAISAAIMLVLLAIISASVLSAHFSSPVAYAHQYEVLEAKKGNAFAMTAVSTAASAAITVAPDDIFTPIALQLAALSRDFLVVLGAIMLQEWLLTILGFLFFGLTVPVCCIALAVAALLPNTTSAKAVILSSALRVLITVAILWGSVPCSVFVSDKIEETHAVSIQSAVEAAEQVEVLSAKDESVKHDNVWACAVDFFSGLFHPVKTITIATEEATRLASNTNRALTALFEGFVVMVVTTCVIPVLTPILSLWLAHLALKPAFLRLQREY